VESLLVLLLVVACLALYDGLWGSGALFIALRAAVRYLRRRHPSIADKLGLGKEICDTQRLNDPAGGLIGRVAVVEQAIVAGRGRLAIDGTTWSVQGPDMPAGTRVMITGAQGTVLVVEAVA
jgi:membrane protein implicated in regulation of membrane protease activity